MAKSVEDIISDAQDAGVSGTIRNILIAGPLATLGYAISYGIDSLQSVFTKPMEALGLGSYDVTMAWLGGLAEILNAGSLASANDIIAQWGLFGWLISIVLVGAAVWFMGWVYDRLNMDFISGVDIPGINLFSGASEEE